MLNKKRLKRIVSSVPIMNSIVDKYRLKKHVNNRLRFLREYIPKNEIGCELGVFKGTFSPVLFGITQPSKLHLVDPWYFLAPKWNWAMGNKSTVSAIIKVLKKFKKEIEEGKVLVHIDDDIYVLSRLPDKYLGWAYIDSSHAYEHTKKELAILKDKVREDGLICGDDWNPSPDHPHHGVYLAVVEFVQNTDFDFIYSNEVDNQWAIKRKVQIN